jgi:tRNA U38,U39,U40 pseudouridine synthase TruA
LTKQGIKLQSLAKIGEELKENQIVASVVPVVETFDCQTVTSEKYYAEMLKSASLSDRYVAAKALSSFLSDSTIEKLTEKINDEKEHIYVRLEAALSLLKLGNKKKYALF